MSSPNSIMFERHAQTALTILVVGLLAWVGFTTQKTQVDMAVVVEKISNMQIQITELKALGHGHEQR